MLVGVPAMRIHVVEGDVSTVTAASDKVLRTDDRILHFEFQTSRDADLPQRVYRYNALLASRHRLPVQSVVLLLRPEANDERLDGDYSEQLPEATEPHVRFRYQVIRVWVMPVEDLLNRGLGVLPLAPIAAVDRNALPGVIQQIESRLRAQPDRTIVGELWTIIRILLGLRYEAAWVEELLKGIPTMEESTTYQQILTKGLQKGREEGREVGLVEGIRHALLVQGKHHFGHPPSAKQQAQIEQLDRVELLDPLLCQLNQAASWSELLANRTTNSNPSPEME